MGFRAYSLGSSPTLEIIDRTHFQVLSRNLRPEWLQLARALSKNTPGGGLRVHDCDETIPGSTKERGRGVRNERVCYIGWYIWCEVLLGGSAGSAIPSP